MFGDQDSNHLKEQEYNINSNNLKDFYLKQCQRWDVCILYCG